MRHLPTSAPILEIGSFCGLSTNLLTYFAERHHVPNPVIACDKWQFEGAVPGKPINGHQAVTHDDYRAFVQETYQRNVRMFSRSRLPLTIEATSDELFLRWGRRDTITDLFGRSLTLGGPLSFCYIDGNHTYAFVRRDFEHCHEVLERGGFLFFDDSSRGSKFPDVHRVVKEIQRLGGYDTVLRNPHYLFKKR